MAAHIQSKGALPHGGNAARQHGAHQQHTHWSGLERPCLSIQTQHRLQLVPAQACQHADRVSLIDQLLEQAEPRDLFGRVEALATLGALGIRQTVATLPYTQRFNWQACQPCGCAGAVHDPLLSRFE